jgi:hypothetical protein
MEKKCNRKCSTHWFDSKLFFRIKLLSLFVFISVAVNAAGFDSPFNTKSGTEAEQKKEVTGTVKDSKGLPLPGVTVAVKGTTTGTITNADGKFRLALPAGARVLTFSFVGM